MVDKIKDPGLFVFQENKNVLSGTGSTAPGKPMDAGATATVAKEMTNPTNLYEYSLGIKDIQAKYVTYGERQAFVTKPLIIPGNVMEVELEATENHALFDIVDGRASDRQTSVEYYISYKNKPSASDWVPLLPKGTRLIQSERLFLQNGEATFRFPAEMDTVVLYENGLRQTSNRFVLLSNQSLSLVFANPNAIYTIDYVPDQYKKDPWCFKLNDYKYDTQTITESFPQGTAFNKTLTLEHYPFVDMQRILAEADYNPNTSDYKPIQVQLTDASIQGRSRTVLKQVEPFRADLLGMAYTYNKTLYRDKSWSELKNYSIDATNYYGGFDYYHWKNKLTFTEHFQTKQLQENLAYTHGNATVEVTYETIITQFRLKIILRRNTSEELTVTPEVADYCLRFKTMK